VFFAVFRTRLWLLEQKWSYPGGFTGAVKQSQTLLCDMLYDGKAGHGSSMLAQFAYACSCRNNNSKMQPLESCERSHCEHDTRAYMLLYMACAGCVLYVALSATRRIAPHSYNSCTMLLSDSSTCALPCIASQPDFCADARLHSWQTPDPAHILTPHSPCRRLTEACLMRVLRVLRAVQMRSALRVRAALPATCWSPS
jgi:hypothetical protein